jgi:hypothetical protein
VIFDQVLVALVAVGFPLAAIAAFIEWFRERRR